jgi:hypothetical protein
MRFSSQRSQQQFHPHNLVTLSPVNEDEAACEEGWWRPALLGSAIAIVVFVHWWILS